MANDFRKKDMGISAAIESELEDWNKQTTTADAQLLRQREKLWQPLWEKRDEIISRIPDFWPQAIANNESLAAYFDDLDQPLIAVLKSIKIHRDVEDPRATKLEFVFGDNEYLQENSLIKEFKLSPNARDLGDTQFDWATDLIPVRTEIKWKSEEMDLCKRKPTQFDAEESESFNPGSFFSSFFDSVHPEIANGIGELIADGFYPMAVDWYTGTAVGDEDFDFESGEEFSDSQSESSEDDDEEDEDAEIDLEALEEADRKPSKRARIGEPVKKE